MAYQNIIYEKQGTVGVIKFNRPKALNALNGDLLAEMQQALDEIEKDHAVRVLILTGEGEKAFVAGADIAFMVNLSPLEARLFSMIGHEIGTRLENLPIPVIACVTPGCRREWQPGNYTFGCLSPRKDSSHTGGGLPDRTSMSCVGRWDEPRTVAGCTACEGG